MNITNILQRPIPDHTLLRERKTNYRAYPLVEIGARDDEPLVAIDDYGIAGRSYYSRPNPATGGPVRGVPERVYVRRRVAERLAKINYGLQQSPEVTELLGGTVELYVEEGFRSAELQTRLYDDVFPALIRSQHPDWPERQVLEYRSQLIAEPMKDGGSPSSHLTGAAVDINLRYQRPDLGFVRDSRVELGRKSGTVGYAAEPDYFEHNPPKNQPDREAQKNRRAFYWVMRGALLGDDSGFTVNPTEWWHWSYGDQLWAQLTNAPEAFYGAVADCGR